MSYDILENCFPDSSRTSFTFVVYFLCFIQSSISALAHGRTLIFYWNVNRIVQMKVRNQKFRSGMSKGDARDLPNCYSSESLGTSVDLLVTTPSSEMEEISGNVGVVSPTRSSARPIPPVAITSGSVEE